MLEMSWLESLKTKDDAMLNYLAHLLELPIFEVPHPESWDETLTIEMAEAILNDWERRQGIDKKR